MATPEIAFAGQTPQPQAPDAPRGFARGGIIGALVLLLTPVIQLAVNPNLFITSSIDPLIDPWVYTGYFLSLPRFLREYPGAYYGSRLPWLLPGYGAHLLFSPLVANYVVHLAFDYALLFGLYFLIRRAAGRQVALIVAVLTAWNPIVLGAMDWDYVDGAGIVFAVWTFACLDRGAASERSGAWCAGAGAMAACAAATNMFLVLLWPVCGAFFLMLRRDRHLIALGRDGRAALAGAMATIVGLGAINHRLGGDWLFFEPSVRMSRALVSAPNQWAIAGYRRFATEYELAIPVMAAIGAAWACFRGAFSRADSGQRFAVAMQFVTLAMIAIWMFFERSGIPVLTYIYYVSYLLPFALVALGLQATAAGCRLGAWQALVVLVVAQLLLAALHASPEFRSTLLAIVAPAAGTDSLRAGVTASAMAITLAGIVALRGRTRPLLRWTVFVVCMSVVYFLTPVVTVPLPTTSGTRDRFASIVEAHRIIGGDTANGQLLRFWYDGKGRPGSVRRGVSSSYLWRYRLLNELWPALKPEEAVALPGKRLVLLLGDHGELEPTLAVLKGRGLAAEQINAHDVGAGDSYIYVVTLTPILARP